MVLSGVVFANQQGNSQDWLRETVHILPGNSVSLGFGLDEGPLNYAINHYSIPRPSQDPRDYTVVFSLQSDSWAPFASLSSIFDAKVLIGVDDSINAGYAVDFWRPSHFVHAVKYPDVTQPINNIFTGINVDIAVRDNDAFIFRLGYHITLAGVIAFAASGSIGG